MKRSKDIIAILAVVLISIIIIASSGILGQKPVKSVYYERALVTHITDEKLEEDGSVPGLYIGSQNIEIQLTTGEHKGEKYNIKNFLSRLYNVRAHEGKEIIVALQMKDNQISNISVFNYKRDNLIYTLVAVFFIALAVIGGIKGVKSIISLLFTGVVIIFLMLPLIFRGFSPLGAAVLTAVLTATVSLYLVGGWNKKTLSAVLGTVLGVVAAGLISYIAGSIGHLSGLTMEEAEQMLQLAADTHMQVKGLMFAAILIASLGAIMDVGMSIASAVYEMHSLDPQIESRKLFRSTMNVGRDIMGTMSNTLILAFAGSSLNIMILILAYKMPYIQIINLDLICTELIQGIAGSIGIILTVPITAAISILLLNSRVKSHSKLQAPVQSPDKAKTIKQ